MDCKVIYMPLIKAAWYIIYSGHIKIAVKRVIPMLQNINSISTEFSLLIRNLKSGYLSVTILNKK